MRSRGRAGDARPHRRRLNADVDEVHRGAVGRVPRSRGARPTGRADRPGGLIQERARRGGVAETRVERRVTDEVPRRVIGAVVEHPDDAVATGTETIQPGAAHPRSVSASRRGAAPASPPTPGGRRGGRCRAGLSPPSTATRARVGLRECAPLVVPAMREQAVVIRNAVSAKWRDDPRGRVAQQPGRDRGHLGEHADPERRCRGEPVDEAAALKERRPVGADERDGILQEAVEAGDVRAVRPPRVRRRPASATRARGRGAAPSRRSGRTSARTRRRASRRPGRTSREARGRRDIGRRPGAADRAQERLHDDHGTTASSCAGRCRRRRRVRGSR